MNVSSGHNAFGDAMHVAWRARRACTERRATNVVGFIAFGVIDGVIDVDIVVGGGGEMAVVIHNARPRWWLWTTPMITKTRDRHQ